MAAWPDVTLKFEEFVPPPGARFVVATYNDGKFVCLLYGDGDEWRRLGSDSVYPSERAARESAQAGVDF